MDLLGLTILNNLVRIGTVSSVSAANHTARVIFLDKMGAGGKPLPSGHLKILKTSNDEWIPEIGSRVLCLFLPNGESDGVILGGLR